MLLTEDADMHTFARHLSTAPAASRTTALLRLAKLAVEAVVAATFVAGFGAAGRAWAAEPWPEVPLPPKADVQWVAQSMRVNGVPTRVMQFQSRAGRSEIAEYYEAHWSGGYEHKPSVHALGEATVVGQMHGPYLMTVKVEDGARGTSVGLISVAQVIGSKMGRDPGELPLMTGAHVISVVESDDPGKHSRAVMIVSPQPASSVAQFYQASLVNAGWMQVQGNDVPRQPGAPAASLVVFARGESEMQLSIVAARNGRASTLLANLVTKDTGLSAN
jgi:hypothetical protein